MANRKATAARRKPTRVKLGSPRPVDVHVGSRIRARRTLLGMSQEKLGAALGLTFQQVQKYEKGTNRVGSSRLWQLTNILDVPVSFFFDDMPEAITGRPMLARGRDTIDPEIATSRETLELTRAYYMLDPKLRKRVRELVRAMARVEGAEEPSRKAA